jgi:2-dehydrotetronate isomerase
VEKALAYAERLKPGFLHVMAGIADPDDPIANGTYRNNLLFVSERAREIGIGITIEPLNSRDVPGYFLSDFNKAREIINELDLSNLFLQFDIYHRQILHGDVLKGLEELMPVTGHIQVSSVPERHEPDTGELNDTRIFSKLDALGYQGLVGCEYRPASSTLEGLGWFSAFRKDRQSAGR